MVVFLLGSTTEINLGTTGLQDLASVNAYFLPTYQFDIASYH